MKKIMNLPEDFVTESLDGILKAYSDRLMSPDKEHRIILSKNPSPRRKVAVVTAGGSGHLPTFLGYVGDGMLDGCAVGNVFASPSSGKMYEMIKAVDRGNGVFCLFGNYSGDSLNFQMACDYANLDNIATIQRTVKDDVASAPANLSDKRRGIAGLVYAYKIAGAAADDMLSLEEIALITDEALHNIKSIGAALTSCIVPEAGKATFTISDNEIEIGMGIHGEPGIETKNMMSADTLADTLLNYILKEMPLTAGDEISVMINGLGATPPEELYILYRRIFNRLHDMNVSICMPHIGEFATSMEMAGCSLTIFKLNEKLKKYLLYPANTPFYTSVNK